MNHPDEPLLTATRETLEAFHDDVQYLWCSDNVPVYENPPSALNFLRNHVALSRPCIIRNSILVPTKPSDEKASENSDGKKDGGDATSDVPLTMTMDDLVRLFPNVDEDTGVGGGNGSSSPSEEGSMSLPPLCVDVTPDGHGDCLRRVAINDKATPAETEERVFVKPLEADMNLSEFCRRLRKGRAKQLYHEVDREDILDKVFDESSKSDNSRNTRDESSDNDEEEDDLFEDCVLYYSRQNDCLREELSPLWNLKRSLNETDDDDDSFLFPRSFPWAEEAFFGQSPAGADMNACVGPDAVNLWMGDERAVSAMHKDHYENLFYVLSGEKVFGLCPPSDAPFLYEKQVLSGRFEVSSKGSDDDDDDDDDGTKQQHLEPTTRNWSVALDREEETTNPSSSDNKKHSKVHWIATDLFGNNSDRVDKGEEFPLSKYAHPITIKVRAGELLYLPSLWFHRVTQTRETIGINYWYDMNFESPMWCYFHLLQQVRPSQEQSTNNRG